MNCAEFCSYIVYCLSGWGPGLPAEAQEHLDYCPQCRVKVEKLRTAYKIECQRVDALLDNEREIKELLALLRECIRWGLPPLNSANLGREPPGR